MSRGAASEGIACLRAVGVSRPRGSRGVVQETGILRRVWFVALIGVALVLSMGVAEASEEKGRAVTLRVVDEGGEPLPNATVRVPGTEGKRRVTRNGEWTESVLYTIEGDEFRFKRGDVVEFHVTAPEYHARAIKYRVRGRLNYVEVALKRMPAPDAALESDPDDLLIRWFLRTSVDETLTGELRPSDEP
jgi:hypothetical protein